MQKLISYLLLPMLLVMHSGCASIISGKQQDIKIASNPAGALVEIDSVSMGRTPLTTTVKRDKAHQILVQKNGYYEQSRVTKKVCNWWVASNLILGLFGLIGWAIDASTGAAYKVDPSEIVFDLEKNGDDTSGSDAIQKTGTESQGATAVLDSKIVQIEKLNKLKEKGLLTAEEFEMKKKEILELQK